MLQDEVKLEYETRQPSDRTRQEGDQVSLSNSWVLQTLREECLISGIAVELLAVIGLCDGIVLDVCFVWSSKG